MSVFVIILIIIIIYIYNYTLDVVSPRGKPPVIPLSVVKAGPTTQCSSDHIFEIITYELMKFCRLVVLYKSYMLNRFRGHVTFGGGVIV